MRAVPIDILRVITSKLAGATVLRRAFREAPKVEEPFKLLRALRGLEQHIETMPDSVTKMQWLVWGDAKVWREKDDYDVAFPEDQAPPHPQYQKFDKQVYVERLDVTEVVRLLLQSAPQRAQYCTETSERWFRRTPKASPPSTLQLYSIPIGLRIRDGTTGWLKVAGAWFAQSKGSLRQHAEPDLAELFDRMQEGQHVVLRQRTTVNADGT